MHQPAAVYVPGRSCDGCTLCCKLLKIEALEKPRLKWCTHCEIGAGCKIYAERPNECRAFDCGYLTQAPIGEHWRPATSRMVIGLATDANRLTVFVDPDRPDAWRKEPYYSDIKGWARAAAKNQGRIVVSLGADVIVVTPEGETNLGPVKDDEVIISNRKRGAGGAEIEHLIVDRDDPVLQALRLIKDPAAAKTASADDLAAARRQVDAWLAQYRK